MGPTAGILESLRARQAIGIAPMRFGSTRTDDSGWMAGWNLGDSTTPLWLSPRTGLEVRTAGDTDEVVAWEAGLRAAGRKGPLWFSTDARIFAERHTHHHAASWDGNVVDRSEEGELSNATFTSWARYRATMELTTPVGAIGFRREPLHWGPGVFGNMVLNKASIPFPHLYYQGDFGQVGFEAFWGRLGIDGIGDYRRTHYTRSAYGHRYEWRPRQDLTLGVSELLILYDQESVAGLVPFAPLFIEKGEVAERENNGNIAFDAAFRKWSCLFYGEFLLDDMQEPTSLFSDRYWGNRWGALLGAMWATTLTNDRTASFGLEWTRIEPWVYGHFEPNSAQALNMGRPVGNPDGPNSQAIQAHGAIHAGDFGASLAIKALWKGSDPGSSATDIAGPGLRSKSFLAGVDEPEWIPETVVWKKFRNLSLYGSLRFERDATTARLRLLSWY